MKMYYIAIVLPEALNEKILSYKKMMQERFGAVVGLKSPAHITIVPPFWMDDANELGLLTDLQSVSSRHPGFLVTTNNFSAFKPRTIFVDVFPNEALKQLKQSAEDFFTSGGYKIKKEDRRFHPHITIATRDLSKKDFHEAWPLFEKKEFKHSFTASGLSLLKHNGKSWDVISTAGFSADHS